MASVKFYLTRKNAKDKTTIFFLCNYGAYEMVDGKKKYLPMKYYTDESIHPNLWNPAKGRAKESKVHFPHYPEFNTKLQDIEDTALNVIRKLQNDGLKLTKETLKVEFDRIWKQSKNMTPGVEYTLECHTEPSISKVELLPFIDHFIKTSTNTKSTIAIYKLTSGNLKEYQESRNVTLSFSNIDMDFYNDFITFLKEKDYAPNTVGCRIKMLKKFLGEAEERGIEVKSDYRRKGFKKPSEETFSIYLNETELMKLYKYDLKDHPKLEAVRDLFLIGSYTGLRFSDLSMLSRENISNNTISSKTIKTGTDVVIPIHPIVRLILEKYQYNLPKFPSVKIFNNRIREVAALAGINEPVYIEKTKGDKRVKLSLAKHEIVSSHTARRSFATNAYVSDVPSISIMKITGHKTEKAFLAYIKISQQDNANKLLNHTFFTKRIPV